MKQILFCILAHFSLHSGAQHHGPMKGNWTATLEKEGILIRFNIDGDPGSRSSTFFLVNEFSSMPKMQKGNFSIRRDAGTVSFNGKFDSVGGSGSWSFATDNAYIETMNGYGINGLIDHEWFALFTMGVSKDYPLMLKNAGYDDISKNDLILLGSQKINEEYIRSWQREGYNNIRLTDLVFLKDQHITPAYVKKFHDLGYTTTRLSQLIELKIVGVTPEFIKSFEQTGLKGISLHDLKRAREAGLTAEDVLALKEKGWNYDSLGKYIPLKIKD